MTNNQFYFLGIYNNQAFFRNTVTMKQVSFAYSNELPEVGTVVTIIFGSRPKVIFSQPRDTQATYANNIAIAMSNYGQNKVSKAIGRAKGRQVLAEARKSYRNSLKYGYHYFC